MTDCGRDFTGRLCDRIPQSVWNGYYINSYERQLMPYQRLLHGALPGSLQTPLQVVLR